MSGKIDEFPHSRFQSARAKGQESKKDGIRNDRPEIEVRCVKLPVNDHAQRNQTNDHCCGDQPVAQPDTGQSFRAGVIFGHSLQDNAPPKVSVDLDVPFVPTGIDRIAPAFFFEQLEDRAEQVMAISPVFAPKNSPAQTAPRFRFGGQMFVRANDTARCSLEMEPGEVARKSAHERLQKSQTHHEQASGNGVEFWFDSRAKHVGQRHRESAAKHQIRNNAQRRQKDSKTKQEEREREPFDTAEVGGQIRLRRRIHRLEKSFAKNAMINDRAINEPTEPRGAVNLTAPFRSPGRTKENQVFESEERFGFAVTFLLFQKRAKSEAPMMPDNRGGTKGDDEARLLQAPAKIDIVAGFMILGIETADLFEGPAIKRHVTAGNVFRFGIGQQNV